jgi:hypothetical protein
MTDIRINIKVLIIKTTTKEVPLIIITNEIIYVYSRIKEDSDSFIMIFLKIQINLEIQS